MTSTKGKRSTLRGLPIEIGLSAGEGHIMCLIGVANRGRMRRQ